MLDVPAQDVVMVDHLTTGVRTLGLNAGNVEETDFYMRDERRPLLPWCLHVADKTLGKTVERRRHFDV
jgi:hypothetical protein